MSDRRRDAQDGFERALGSDRVTEEATSGRPAEPVFSLARLWETLVRSLPDGWTASFGSAEGDNGWQIDPNGRSAPGTDDDSGWQLDPDG